MQHKRITLEVEVEYDFHTGLTGKFEVRHTIFTEYDSLLDLKEVMTNYRAALKRLGNFTMITATLTLRDNNDYGWHKVQDVVKSWRYVNRYDDVTFAPWNGNRYEEFTPTDKKSIESRLADLVDLANKTYILALKESIAA